MVAPALDGDLQHLLVGDAGVLVLPEVHLGVVEAVEEPGQSTDLLLGHGPELIGHIGVATADGDLHETTSGLGCYCRRA